MGFEWDSAYLDFNIYMIQSDTFHSARGSKGVSIFL